MYLFKFALSGSLPVLILNVIGGYDGQLETG